MAPKRITLKRKALFVIVTSGIILGTLVGLGEIATRIFYKPKKEFGAEVDAQLGWRPKTNYVVKQKMFDLHGNAYEATYRTVQNGFREFGAVHSNNYKILFIGDSYTQAVEVSNHQTFYHLIGDSLPVEIFAIGQSGYGSLQELLILQKYFAEISPDLVVLQVCDNDFLDNHFDLEREALYKVRSLRPYLDAYGQINYRSTQPSFVQAVRGSKFLCLLADKYEQAFYRKSSEDTTIAEFRISEFGHDYQPYFESLQITRELLKRFTDFIGGRSDFFIFSAHAFGNQNNDYRQICAGLHIPFYDGPSKEMIIAKRRGANYHSHDGWHWNPAGHQYMAHALIPLIAERRTASALPTKDPISK